MTWAPSINACDEYLGARTGCYEWRQTRYLATLNAMTWQGGLKDADTLVDVGAGWTELDHTLRTAGSWKGRYIPVDGGIDGVDLNEWVPPRDAEWFVALEILEHLYEPYRLLYEMQTRAHKGVIISTPNPATTDVLAMDPTHVQAVHERDLAHFGFDVTERAFYGRKRDSLFGIWTP